jgi:hypothetical protein
MGVSVDIEVAGIKDALAKLNRIDKKLRMQITKDFKEVMQPVVEEAQGRLPFGAPLSGMNYKWTTKSGYQILPWAGADDTVKAAVSGKKVREFAGFQQNLGTFFIRYKGPTAVLFDMTGRKTPKTDAGKRFANQLNATKYGLASRVLWPAWEAAGEKVVDQVRALVKRVINDPRL